MCSKRPAFFKMLVTRADEGVIGFRAINAETYPNKQSATRKNKLRNVFRTCRTVAEILLYLLIRTNRLLYFTPRLALASYHDCNVRVQLTTKTVEVVNSKTFGKLTASFLLSLLYSSGKTATGWYLFFEQ